MGDRLAQNMFSAAGQVVLQTLALLILYRFLIDSIGVERLGVWSIILATVSAARLSELGLGASVTRFVASHRAKENFDLAGEAVQTAGITLAVVFGIVLLPAYYLLQFALPYLLPAAALDEAAVILPYAIISLWLNALAGVWMSGLDGALRSDTRSAIMVTGSLLLLVLAFLVVPQHGLVGLAVAQVGQGLMLVVTGWLLLRKVMRGLPIVPLRWSPERLKEMLGYGVNFQINTVVMLLFEPITKLLLGHYGELAAAGYFEMAQRLVMKVRGLVVESNRVIVPVLAAVDRDEAGTAVTLYSKNLRYLLFLLTPIFALLALSMPSVSVLWVGAYEAQFVSMSVCLSGAWYINALTAPAYFAYLGEGRLRWITISHIFMGCTNVVLGLLLGWLFGWPGVIGAFALSLVLGSLLPVNVYHRSKDLRLSTILSRVDWIFSFVCVAVALLGLQLQVLVLASELHAWGSICSTIAISALVVFVAAWRHPARQEVVGIGKAALRRVGNRKVDTGLGAGSQ